MSRGIRDLRDLICVSRLTVRNSDDDIFTSDDDDVSQLTRKLSKASLSSQTSRDSSAAAQRDGAPSPDSGIGKALRNTPYSLMVTLLLVVPVVLLELVAA